MKKTAFLVFIAIALVLYSATLLAGESCTKDNVYVGAGMYE